MTRAHGNGIAAPQLAAALYLGLAAVLLALILVRTHGHFSYCLDDPYIHLALAERLRHGLYGLNTGEPASPSSSILWPLLFVPFASTAIMPWLPLILNLACGTATAWLLGVLANEIPSRHRDTAGAPWRTNLLAVLFVLAFNLFGLAFTGLEHSLQVLLCIACAVGVVRAMRGDRVPEWVLVAAILLPSVRYEGLLITVALAIALVGARAWRRAVAIVLASAIIPAAFSVFLHHLGLPWFPLSVLVKSSYKLADTSSPLHRVAHLLLQIPKYGLFDSERLPQIVITVALAALVWKHRRTRSLLFGLTAATFVSAVQVVLGPSGWFFRYEIYALAFTVPILLAATALPGTAHRTESDLGTRSRPSLEVTSPALQARAPQSANVRTHALLAVAVLAAIYLRPLVNVPRAALGIYEQQFQLGRLFGEMYHTPVAVNDLGWVSYRRTPDQYTLDLYGLGSYEAFRTKEKDRNAAWLDAITREHHVGLVAIYPEWFTHGIPANWAAVAKLCAPDVDTNLGPVSKRFMVYQTSEADPVSVSTAIEQWRATVPPHVTVQLHPTNNSETCQ
ncbi:hypothetical protein [Terriglobus aquaticus]|uniref:DUF2029 domain-containing protein n=1 Tax=Terriglobus aquaticus TaxID=940139 RepID=A0ABW9KNI5_9BACT|nr:hypothetical protein [Terriglobus aquaticus]